MKNFLEEVDIQLEEIKSLAIEYAQENDFLAYMDLQENVLSFVKYLAEIHTNFIAQS